MRERVTIHWYAVPNTNTRRGGWSPVFDLNGKQHGSPYSQGYDLATALEMARAEADEEAGRYVGDWDVIVAKKPGSEGKTARAPRAAKKPTKVRDDLPWKHSYANWTVRAGEAAAKYGASISYGPGTYEAWEAGISPEAYAQQRGRR